ncbi:MAG: tetratricopeptide repeat protein [Saprospiraceae bacterium]|nr:tetratricopeptide repeat protein [Saprospiraceae bacterium]
MFKTALKKQVNILVILFILLTQSGFGSNSATVDSANAAYAKGDYQKAMTHYQSIIDNGYEAADLYYNLGNSYFKTSDIPSAILYWEKALKLKPNDEDIDFNIKVANTLIADKIEAVPDLFFKEWWKSMCNLFSSNTWTKIGLATFFIFIVLLAFFRLSRSLALRKASFWIGMVFLLFSLLSIGFAYTQHKNITAHKEAIIFTPTVTVKSSPDEKSTDLFVIHEGLKIELQDNVGDWYKIKIANGSIGWIEEGDFRRI